MLFVVCGEVSDIVIIEVDIEFVFLVLLDMFKFCIGDEVVIELSDYVFFYIWFDCDGQAILVLGDSIIVLGDVVGEICFWFSVFNECGMVEVEVIVYVVFE